jgi:hypothetical protein
MIVQVVFVAAAAVVPSPFPLHWHYPTEAANMYLEQLNSRPACYNTSRHAELPSCCARSRNPASCAPDEWALAAALLYKHNRQPFWKAQAIGQLANFTAAWKNATADGKAAYDRSGFFGWTLPLAYAELVAVDGAAATGWGAVQLTDFKRACHSFLAPQVLSADGRSGDVPGCNPRAPDPAVCWGTPKMGDGYWEIGNWNKGFNHWADSVAMVHAFAPSGSAAEFAPLPLPMYKTYNGRMEASWMAQHPYEENSCNYNGISYYCVAAIGYMQNSTKKALPTSIHKLFANNYGRYVIPHGPSAGCMPGWGGSNTACENAGQWAPVFELLGALYGDSQMRYSAARLFAVANTTGQADPITFMLAQQWLDAEVAVSPKVNTGPMLGFRRSPGLGPNASKHGDEYGRLVAEKLVLTNNDSQIGFGSAGTTSDASAAGDLSLSGTMSMTMSEYSAPIGVDLSRRSWAMVELFATTTLYHAVPTLPGHIIHWTANGSLFLDSPRKHWPHSAQGNQFIFYPKSPDSAKGERDEAIFPWYSAEQLVGTVEGTAGESGWQLASVPTRFLGADSNDAKYMTLRHLRNEAFALLCLAKPTYNCITSSSRRPNNCSSSTYPHTKEYKLYFDEFSLVGPDGNQRLLDDFEGATDADWSGGGAKILPAGGANGTARALLITCAPNATTVARRSATAKPSLDVDFDSFGDYDHLRFFWKVSSEYSNSVLSQSFPFAINTSTSIDNRSPLGNFSNRHVGTDGGNIYSNAVPGVDELSNSIIGDATNDNSIWMPRITNTSASVQSNTKLVGRDVGGGLTMRHSFFHGTEHTRVVILANNPSLAPAEKWQTAMVVFDRFAAPPAGAGQPVSFFGGPVFNLRASGVPAPVGKSGFVASGFSGTYENQSLAVAMFSSAFADPLANLGGVNFTGPCTALPTPDLCRVDSPTRHWTSGITPGPEGKPTSDSSQVFARGEIPAGGVASFATVLVPIGAVTDAVAVIGGLKADFSPKGGGASVDVFLGGGPGVKLSISSDLTWSHDHYDGI